MRLDPGFDPTRRAKEFKVSHGGGEANVAYGLASCFGMRSTLLTALVDDGIGRNIETIQAKLRTVINQGDCVSHQQV